MKTEFVRYGLDKWRMLIGALQLLGALSLILGYFYFPILTIIAATGLSILMILGFGVRLKIKDTAMQSVPSLFYALINAGIAIIELNRLH
ncbi:DoxX family protein [Spongiivirga citrea]|nr:DoxX family protein [Spongiivirga citrea]